jgi:4-amino-4-deoxy-L-arabinose transferase-like glycosyltransferase
MSLLKLEHRKQQRRTLIQVSLFLLALMVRLTLFIIASGDEHRFIRPDTPKYVRPAINMVDHGKFSSGTEEPFEPEFNIVPVFPTFIIAGFSVFGRSYTMLALILLLIDSLVPVIIYRIGERWRSWKVGMAAGLLYAVNLLCVVSCQHILSDSLFTFFLSLQLLFFIRFFREGQTRDLVLTTVFLGIMALTRPIALYWIFILLAFILFARPLPGNRRALRIIIAAVIFAAICAPWIARNVRGGAGFRLVTITAKGVRYNFAAAVEAEVTGIRADSIRAHWRESDEILFDSNPGLFPDEDSRYRYRMDRGLETIRNHPMVFAKLCARPYVLLPAVDGFYEHIGVTAGGRGTLDILTRKGPFEAVDHYFGGKTWLIIPVLPWILILGVTYLGTFRGLYICIREKDRGAVISFVFFALFYLAILGTNTLSRYRLPAMPAITLMAGLGITSWKRPAEEK